MSLFRSAEIHVFWDVEDCPIPNGRNPDAIYQNIQSALANEGYTGTLSIMAYKEKLTFPEELLEEFRYAGIWFAPEGDKSARLNKMSVDILYWALNKMGVNLMVISKNNTELVSVLEDLTSKGHCNVLFAMPGDEVVASSLPAVSSAVWLWTTLLDGGIPIYQDQRGNYMDTDSDEEGPVTSVFWDMEDCKIPDGLNAVAVSKNIKLALKSIGYEGPVSISAYGDTKDHFDLARIKFKHFPAVERNARLKQILTDILAWTVGNSQQTRLMLILGDISDETALVGVLQIK